MHIYIYTYSNILLYSQIYIYIFHTYTYAQTIYIYTHNCKHTHTYIYVHSTTPPPHHRGGRGTVLWLTHDHGRGGGGLERWTIYKGRGTLFTAYKPWLPTPAPQWRPCPASNSLKARCGLHNAFMVWDQVYLGPQWSPFQGSTQQLRKKKKLFFKQINMDLNVSAYVFSFYVVCVYIYIYTHW